MRRFSHSHTFDVQPPSWPRRRISFQEPGDTDDRLPLAKPTRKFTQKEQDEEDEKARRKAMKDLVASWNDRLQLISLITTFLASVEAGLLEPTAPESDDTGTTETLVNACNACILSALIIHLHASFISFVGAFFLVRFKVKEARKQEQKIEGVDPSSIPQSKGSVILDMAAKQITDSPKTAFPASPSTPRLNVWSADPQLVQVGPFLRQPPINLLSRCHFLCILCTVLGFLLALAGVILLAWARHPLTVAITASVFVGLCLASGFGIMFTKYDASHVLYD
ncbi:hypothetical protein VNI00_011607 [Paramarasmius palmivorus]|uniref:Transmembrane protein n=1 Tax=Paramarasmius palmivorus TaxID=297713 RepID=A0AAW0CCR2_9AGAR